MPVCVLVVPHFFVISYVCVYGDNNINTNINSNSVFFSFFLSFFVFDACCCCCRLGGFK